MNLKFHGDAPFWRAFFLLFLTCSVSLIFPGISRAGAMLKGTITYGGEVPPVRVINMWLDPNCEKAYAGKPKPAADVLVLGTERQVANVLVRVKSGLDPAKTWPVPAGPITLDQKGCLYFPKVTVVRKGQPLTIVNSDPTLHNVHGRAVKNTSFNLSLPAGAAPQTKTFDEPEGPFSVECNVHPWMQGFVAVSEHPFHAVTGPDGKFEIKDLPPGKYEIEIWHAKLGAITVAVPLVEGETKTLDYVLKRSRRKLAASDVVVIDVFQ